MRLPALFVFVVVFVVALLPGARAFETRSFRRTRRVAITVHGDDETKKPSDAFSTVAGVSLSYRDADVESESEFGTALDDVVRAHAAHVLAARDESVSALSMMGPRPFRFAGVNATIVVLDSGCAGNSELQASVPTFVPNEPPRDLVGHGTAVLRTVREVAPRAEVVCVKIFDRKLLGTVGRTMQAFAWAKQTCAAHARTCVVLLAGGGRSPVLSTFADSLVAPNFTIVASAGNTENQPCDDPANGARVVSVGALGATGKTLATYSAAGPCVSVLAPGWIQLPNPATVVAGTSFSAALVAGVAAMLVENTQTWRLSPTPLKREMIRGAKPSVVRGTARTNTTSLVAQVPPYVFASEAEPDCATAQRRWFVRTPGRFSFVVSRNGSYAFEVLGDGDDALIRLGADDGFLVVQGERTTTHDADDDRREVVVDGETVALCSPRACFFSAPLRTASATLGVRCGSFRNVTVAETARNETVVPLQPPCAKRASPAACTAKPVSPADASCVWMGAGFRCIRADYCGFRTRSACARRSPVCTWFASTNKCGNVV